MAGGNRKGYYLLLHMNKTHAINSLQDWKLILDYLDQNHWRNQIDSGVDHRILEGKKKKEKENIKKWRWIMLH